uniref:Uncharacterized protein n=1 Tax=Mucochytrium quahogii TaxID=96639 RepID=A0A7S2S9K3_9STRA|mmetsp:Transcript_15339/g.26984  ORF Transcript_15339/g.26984 Transcript_15339/m.26984 type:complete len:545 (+) Transcript_15339:489-2123(+)
MRITLAVVALNATLGRSTLLENGYATSVLPISCENRQGYFSQVNGGPIEVLKGSQILTVAAGHKVAVAICNVGNKQYDSDTQLFDGGLVKGVVQGVGEGAHLRVDIVNSGNIQLNNASLAIGEQISSSPLRIIGQVVTGIVANDVRVSVNVAQSANIVMYGDRNIDISRGSLLGDVINGDKTHISQNSILQVTVTDSCNIVNGATLGELHILDGQLDDQGLDFPVSSSFIFVNKTNASNVHMGKVYIEQGELSDESFHTPLHLQWTGVTINARGSSNVEANSLHLTNSELIDEAFQAYEADVFLLRLDLEDCGNAHIAEHSFFNESKLVDQSLVVHYFLFSDRYIDMKNTGNIFGKQIHMLRSKLVDEHIDAFNLFYALMRISVSNIANVQAEALFITDGELLDEGIHWNEIEHSLLDQNIINGANVQAPKLEIHDGQLLDATMYINKSKSLTLTVEIDRCATHDGRRINSSELHIQRGQLLTAIIEMPLCQNPCSVTVKNTSNSHNNHVTLGVNATLLNSSDAPNVRFVNSGNCTGDVSCTSI